MKTKFMKVAFVAAAAMVFGLNMLNAQKTAELSDIALANVEALMQNAQARNVYCPNDGYGCKLVYSNGTYEIIWGKIPAPKTDDEESPE